jgi:hypothetical protein
MPAMRARGIVSRHNITTKITITHMTVEEEIASLHERIKELEQELEFVLLRSTVMYVAPLADCVSPHREMEQSRNPGLDVLPPIKS